MEADAPSPSPPHVLPRPRPRSTAPPPPPTGSSSGEKGAGTPGPPRPESGERSAVPHGRSRSLAYVYAVSRGRAGAVSQASMHVPGADMQGIPWRDIGADRIQYREHRIRSYRRHPELSAESKEILASIRPPPSRDQKFYSFNSTARTGNTTPNISHFQLRHLLVAGESRSRVTFLSKRGVCELHMPSVRTRKLFTFDGDFSAMGGRHQVCSMLRHQDLVMLGTFQGHLLIKSVSKMPDTWTKKDIADEDQKTVPNRSRITEFSVSEAKDSICNALTTGTTPGGAPAVIISNNDKMIMVLDLHSLQPVATIATNWAVNHTSAAPASGGTNTKDLIAAVGDTTDGLLYDLRTCKPIATLSGHTDFSFSTAWHPHMPHIATGNQDQTCRIWDIRSLKKEAAILGGRMASVRAVSYSHDGNFIAFAEAADFVHVHSTRNLSLSQEIDVFGELAGFQFSQDDEAIFIGIADSRYGCIVEWTKPRLPNRVCPDDEVD